MKVLFASLIIFSLFFVFVVVSNAQSSAFSYQGKLTESGAAANGQYDFVFRLYDQPSGGTQIGADLVKEDVPVTAGIFTVTLNFGSSPFTANNGNFLEMSVRTGTSTGAFTLLTPRQQITSSPYAVQTLRADSAVTADTAANFSGNLAGDVTGSQGSTIVTRLQGRTVASSQPTAGQGLVWNNTSSQWEPGNTGGGTITGVTSGTGLSGGGTSGSVSLSVANGGIGTTQLADSSVTDTKISSVSGSKVIGAVATATNSSQLGGTPANQFIQSTDTRLTDARPPTAGSPNYIQNNPVAQQMSSGFNVSGTGKANILDAGLQYNLNGSRVLFRTTGPANTVLGEEAGLANPVGGQNSLFGVGAGRALTTGSANSFFGLHAGRSTTTTHNNSFFGIAAGSNSTGSANSLFGSESGFMNTGGSSNSMFGGQAGWKNISGSGSAFFGERAGFNNVSGNFNTALGVNADVGSGALAYATAIGANSTVNASDTIVIGKAAGTYNGDPTPRPADSVQIPGDLYVAGTLNATLPFGSTNYIQNSLTTQANSFFNISGNGTVGGTLSGGVVNAGTQFNIGGNRIFAAPGTDNLFAGRLAGNSTTGGVYNSFFGFRAGEANIGGSSNSFFGERAGLASLGINNSFFGAVAGQTNTTGTNNTAVGTLADFATPDLTYATAIGAGAVVGSSDTIQLGRASGVDTVVSSGPIVAQSFTGNGSTITNINGANILANSIPASSLAQDSFAGTRNLARLGSLRWDLLTQTVGVGFLPDGLAFDGENIWVASPSSGNVTKIRTSDSSVQGTFSVASVYGLAFDGANIWAANRFSDTVTKLRAADGAVLGVFSVTGRPVRMAFDGSNIWTTNTNAGTVTKLRANDGSHQGTFNVGARPEAIAFDGINIWVANMNSDTVTKLRASDGSVQGTFAVGDQPGGIVFDGANIWVANQASANITKLRASDGAILGTFAMGIFPHQVAFDGANIWIACQGNDFVAKLRASDGALLGNYQVGDGPLGLAFDGFNIWVSNSFAGTVSKLPVFP